MKNTGTENWTAENNYSMGSQNPQDNGIWGTGRVYLSAGESIETGANKTFTFGIVAPESPGTYNFQWRMLREGVEWFGDYSLNIVINVTAVTTTTTSTFSTTTTSTSTTSTTVGECLMPGNDPPCGELSLSEVVAGINQWAIGNMDLGEVIDLIDSWVDPSGHPAN